MLLQSVSVTCSTLDVHVKPYEEFPLQTFELTLTLGMQNKNTGFPFNQEPGVGLPLLGMFGGQVQLCNDHTQHSCSEVLSFNLVEQ